MNHKRDWNEQQGLKETIRGTEGNHKRDWKKPQEWLKETTRVTEGNHKSDWRKPQEGLKETTRGTEGNHTNHGTVGVPAEFRSRHLTDSNDRLNDKPVSGTDSQSLGSEGMLRVVLSQTSRIPVEIEVSNCNI